MLLCFIIKIISGCIRLKIGKKELLISIGILFLLFFLLLFKTAGLRFILGFLVIFIVPVYLILDIFKFDPLERSVYSFFLGIGVVPTLVYYLGLIISFRIAIAVVFVTLIAVWFILRKYPVKLSSKP